MAPPRYDFGPSRRRRSPLPIILLVLLAALIGLFIYMGLTETSVPQQRIEQDVTSEILQ